jgi:hypothetical protein
MPKNTVSRKVPSSRRVTAQHPLPAGPDLIAACERTFGRPPDLDASEAAVVEAVRQQEEFGLGLTAGPHHRRP